MGSKNPTAGIVLAAGMSRRFGSPKLLLQWQGRTLIEIVVDAALNSQLQRVVVVLGHRCQDIFAAVAHLADHPRLAFVENKEYRYGLGRSVRIGLEMVRHDYPSVMFLPADQPLVTSFMIDRLLHRFWASDKDICIPVAGGRQGNPTLFSRRFYHGLMQIDVDKGGRDVIRMAPDRLITVEQDDPRCLMDIDTPHDLERLLLRINT